MDFESQYDGMTDEEIRAESRALHKFETESESGWLRRAEYCPEAFDEMVRQDMEWKS